MLIVNLDALQTIDFLNLVDQVLGQLLFTEDAQDIVRVARTIHERLTGTHEVTFMNADVLTFRNQVFLRLTDLRCDHDLALAFRVFTECDCTVDLGNHGKLLGLAGLEELGNARQTTGDVLGLGGFTRNLRQDVTRTDNRIFLNQDVGADRHHAALCRLIAFIFDRNTRTFVSGLGLDDDLAGQTRDIIDLLFDGQPFDEVTETNLTRCLGENRHGEGVPLCQNHPLGDRTTFSQVQAGTVNHTIAFTLAAGFINNSNFGIAVHNHQIAVSVLGRRQVDKLERTLGAGLEGGLLRLTRSGTTDMEGTHGQLGSRLTDRLGSDDTDRLAEVDDVPTGQVATIAGSTDTATTLACQHRADMNLLDTGVFDFLHQGFVDFDVGLNEDLVGHRVHNIVERGTAENTIAQRLNDFTALNKGADLDTVQRTAVIFHDDGVLGNVDQTTGQVTGVGRLERRIGETLTGTVGRDEVLENRQALTEVSRDRCFDDRAIRLGHQTTHTGQLTDLLVTTSGTRVGHHVNRVKRGHLDGFAIRRERRINSQLGKHRLGNIFRALGPDIDNLVVALAIGDQTLGILPLDFLDFVNRSRDELFLRLGDNHVVQAD